MREVDVTWTCDRCGRVSKQDVDAPATLPPEWGRVIAGHALPVDASRPGTKYRDLCSTCFESYIRWLAEVKG